MRITPRQYQSEDLSALRIAARSGARRIIFEASVGYGKTIIMLLVAMAYVSVGKRVLILSNRTSVIEMLRDEIGESDLIKIMTVQSAVNRLDIIDKPAVILIDELHMGGAAGQYRSVFEVFENALVIGFTGTPKAALFEVFDAHVQAKSARWLTDHGFLSPLKYFCPETIDFSRIRTVGSDFDEDELVDAMERSDICGDAIESYRQHCVGRPTLVFTVNIKHAKAVQEEFQAAGIECETLTSEDDEDETARKIALLKSGGLLISVDRVSAGFNVPALHAIISLRPTRQPHLWVQQLGRVARLAEEKVCGWVFDHAGNTLRNGTLTEDRDWRNGDQVDDERQTEEGERLSVRVCSCCNFAWEGAATFCPECGHENGQDRRISKRKAIQLREQEAADIEAARQAAAAAARRAQGKAKTFKALAAEIAKRPGTRNIHSARASASKILAARMRKAVEEGRTEEAEAIHADLAANGHRKVADETLADIEAAV